MYPVNLTVTLRPIWHDEKPLIRIGTPENLNTLYLDKLTTFELNHTASLNSSLIVEFLNKTNKDTILDKNLDKAVIIEDISFFGISDEKFIWAGVYKPIYPEHLLDNPAELTNLKYLGFNGQWKLDFTVPVFTWIHDIQHLGWVYN